MDSNNGWSPIWRHTIIWISADLILTIFFRLLGKNLSEIVMKYNDFHSVKHIRKYHLQNVGHLAQEASVSIYRQVSKISCTLAGNKFVNHLDVVGAPPVGAAPTTS